LHNPAPTVSEAFSFVRVAVRLLREVPASPAPGKIGGDLSCSATRGQAISCV